MTLRFIDGLPVLGYLELDDRVLAFAWLWHEPTLRLTFIEGPSPLIGHVTHLDGIPRLTPAPDNLAWLHQDDPARPGAVLDHAIELWRRKDRIFREHNG